MLHVLDVPTFGDLATVSKIAVEARGAVYFGADADATRFANWIGKSTAGQPSGDTRVDLAGANPEIVARAILSHLTSDTTWDPSVELMCDGQLLMAIDIAEGTCQVSPEWFRDHSSMDQQLDFSGRVVGADPFDEIDACREFMNAVCAAETATELRLVIRQALDQFDSAVASSRAARWCVATALLDANAVVVGGLVRSRFGAWCSFLDRDVLVQRWAREAIRSLSEDGLPSAMNPLEHRVHQIAEEAMVTLSAHSDPE